MIILEQLKHLIHLANNEDIPAIGQLAMANFVLQSIALSSFLNILIYFIIIKILENKTVTDKIQNYKILNKIFKVYKNTRIYFLIYEIIFFLFINVFILWQSYRLFSIYL